MNQDSTAVPPAAPPAPPAAPPVRPLLALGLVVLASLAFALVAATVKELSTVPGCGAAPPILSRGLVGFALCALWARQRGRTLRPSSWRMLAWRCAAGVGAIACYYRALGPGGTDMVTAALLLKTSPLWVAVLSPWLVNERSSGRTWLGLAVGAIGVVVASLDPAKGWAPDLASWGIGLALVSGAFSGLAYVALRQLARTDDPLTVVATFSAALVLVSLPLSLVNVHHVGDWGARTWGLLAAAGLLGTGGQLLLTAAYRHGTAAAVAIGGLSELAMQGAISVLYFHQAPTREALIGGGLAMLAGFIASQPAPKPVLPPAVAPPGGAAALDE